MRTVAVKITGEVFSEELVKVGTWTAFESVDIEDNEDPARAIDYALEIADDSTKWTKQP